MAPLQQHPTSAWLLFLIVSGSFLLFPHPVQDGSQGAGRCSLTSSVSLNLVFFDNVTDVPSFITQLFPTRMPLTLLGQRLQSLYTQRGVCIRCFAIISNSIHSKTEPISFSCTRLALSSLLLLNFQFQTSVFSDSFCYIVFSHMLSASKSWMLYFYTVLIFLPMALLQCRLLLQLFWHSLQNTTSSLPTDQIKFTLCSAFRLIFEKGSPTSPLLFKIDSSATEGIKVQPWHLGLQKLDFISPSSQICHPGLPLDVALVQLHALSFSEHNKRSLSSISSHTCLQ